MRKLTIPQIMAALIAGSQLVSCSQPAGVANGVANETAPAAAAAAAAPDEVRFYGRESFTIVSTQTGAESGTVTEHVRDWGRRRVEIKDATLAVAGQSIRQHHRVVHDGSRIATVDLETGSVTVAENPLYGRLAAAMRGRSGVEIGEQMMIQLGGRRTGERATIAGHACEYWEVAQLGARSCVTPWGATLSMRVAMGAVSFERIATEVRLDDGGADEAFAYDSARATQVPSLDDIRNRMRGN